MSPKSLLLKCNGLIHLKVHHLKFTIKSEHNNQVESVMKKGESFWSGLVNTLQ